MATTTIPPARQFTPATPKPIGAAIYARVSTRNGQNPEMQLQELRGYCQRRGWEIAGEFVDQGISGAKERRPALDRLLADCRGWTALVTDNRHCREA